MVVAEPQSALLAPIDRLLGEGVILAFAIALPNCGGPLKIIAAIVDPL